MPLKATATLFYSTEKKILLVYSKSSCNGDELLESKTTDTFVANLDNTVHAKYNV